MASLAGAVWSLLQRPSRQEFGVGSKLCNFLTLYFVVHIPAGLALLRLLRGPLA